MNYLSKFDNLKLFPGFVVWLIFFFKCVLFLIFLGFVWFYLDLFWFCCFCYVFVILFIVLLFFVFELFCCVGYWIVFLELFVFVFNCSFRFLVCCSNTFGFLNSFLFLSFDSFWIVGLVFWKVCFWFFEIFWNCRLFFERVATFRSGTVRSSRTL